MTAHRSPRPRLARPILTASLLLALAAGLSACNDEESYDEQTLNTTPKSYPASYSVTLNSTLAITLGGTDQDNDALSFSIVNQPSHGTLSGSGKSWTYSPATGYFGIDSFSYRVNDGVEDSALAKVTLIVAADNSTPVAASKTVVVKKNSSETITLTAGDNDSDALSYSITQRPSHGVIDTLSGSTIVYTPFANYLGTDSFAFVVTDGSVNSNTATIQINVTETGNPVADSTAPVAYPQILAVLRNGSINFALDAEDPNGKALEYSYTELPENGDISGTPPNLTYTPADDFIGTEKLKFTAFNGEDYSNEAVIRFDVEPENSAPVGYNDYELVVDAGESDVEVDLTAIFSDADQDALSYAVVSTPGKGTLRVVNNRMFYTPFSTTSNTTDSFRVRANDGLANSDVVTVHIQIL